MQQIIPSYRGAAVLLLVVGILLLASPVQAGPYSALVVDPDSGRVLLEENADAPRYPASLTKMMTLYLVFEALNNGRLNLGRPLGVSSAAAARPPSKLGLRSGDVITVEQAISALVTLSANDAATVLAEGLGGSEGNFARMMTSRAHALGMTQTYFRNASGLPDPFQVTTAWDMFKLARALQQQAPQYYHYFSKDSFYFRNRLHRNHNHLLETYPGADGIKTGYIRTSGFNLVASAQRNGRRLIGVVFGGETARARDENMRGILDMGFAQLGVSGPSWQFASRSYSPSAYPTTLTPYSRGAGFASYQPVRTVATTYPAPAASAAPVDGDRFNGAYSTRATPANPASPVQSGYGNRSGSAYAVAVRTTAAEAADSAAAPPTRPSTADYVIRPFIRSAEAAPAPASPTTSSTRYDWQAPMNAPAAPPPSARPAPTDVSAVASRSAITYVPPRPTPTAQATFPSERSTSTYTYVPPRPTLTAQATPPSERSTSTYTYVPPRPTLTAQATPPSVQPAPSWRSGSGAPVRLAANDKVSDSAGDDEEPGASAAAAAPATPRYTSPGPAVTAPDSRTAVGTRNVDLVSQPMYEETDSESSTARPDLFPKSVSAAEKPAPAVEKKPAPTPKAAAEPAASATRDEAEAERPAPRARSVAKEPAKGNAKAAVPAAKKEQPERLADTGKQAATQTKAPADPKAAGQKNPPNKAVAQTAGNAKPVDKAAQAQQRTAAPPPAKTRPGADAAASRPGATRNGAVAQAEEKGGYQVQVGAFSSKADAARQLSQASQSTPELSRSRAVVVPVVKDGKTLYRASFKGLNQHGAGSACQALKRKQQACLISQQDG